MSTRARDTADEHDEHGWVWVPVSAELVRTPHEQQGAYDAAREHAHQAVWYAGDELLIGPPELTTASSPLVVYLIWPFGKRDAS